MTRSAEVGAYARLIFRDTLDHGPVVMVLNHADGCWRLLTSEHDLSQTLPRVTWQDTIGQPVNGASLPDGLVVYETVDDRQQGALTLVGERESFGVGDFCVAIQGDRERTVGPVVIARLPRQPDLFLVGYWKSFQPTMFSLSVHNHVEFDGTDLRVFPSLKDADERFEPDNKRLASQGDTAWNFLTGEILTDLGEVASSLSYRIDA